MAQFDSRVMPSYTFYIPMLSFIFSLICYIELPACNLILFSSLGPVHKKIMLIASPIHGCCTLPNEALKRCVCHRSPFLFESTYVSTSVSVFTSAVSTYLVTGFYLGLGRGSHRHSLYSSWVGPGYASPLITPFWEWFSNFLRWFRDPSSRDIM